MPSLIFLTFGNNVKAQVPSYVGVAEGQEIIWKAEANFAGVDVFLGNVRDVLVDFQTNLPSLDLFGLESLTIDEIVEQIADVYLSNVLPVGWQGLNISTLIKLTIEEYLVKFNSTILAGMIPSNWQALNFSDFYDLVVDGLNATMPTGWEDNPIPELYKMTINELNSTLFYGLIPSGWEDLTIEEFLRTIMMTYTPVIAESFVIQMTIDSLMSMGLPPGYVDLTLSELLDEMVAMFPPEIANLNATALFEMMFLGLNQSMPGIESMNMTTLIDFLIVGINSTFPMGMGFDSLSMTELLGFGIDAYLNMTIPMELRDLTILEILDLSVTEAINAFDTVILPGWTDTYAMLQAAGLLGYEVGLKVLINSIGTEVEAYPGGPVGVPIDMDVFISVDGETWMNVSALFDMGGLILMPYAFIPLIGSPLITPFIVDPSSYTMVDTALIDQFMFTGTLIVANNYDWNTIQTEMTIATTGNPDSIEMSVNWNANGLLQSAAVHADGIVVASLTLESAGIIPGYEIPLILGITSLTIIAIILYKKKKNTNIK
ncbi:MAG: hypothetical protein ACFFB6_01675 [Promethearchaeota archaeon]